MTLPIIELLIFATMAAFLLGYSLGGWLGVCVTALILLIPINLRSIRARCPSCGKRPITVRGIHFCGQCGSGVSGLRFGIWCRSCRRIARSELNVQYCNRCGSKN